MKTRVIFFGSSIHSLPALENLTKQDYLQVVAVVTQPDRPVGRKQVITPTPVAGFAQKNNIEILKFESNPEIPWFYKNQEEVAAIIKKYQPDLIVVCYYGQKLPSPVINIPPKGTLNIHPSLLPKYRGAAPAEWAILNGEKETGVTILTLTPEFDNGKIIIQEPESLYPNDTSETAYQRLFTKGAQLLINILPDYLAGQIAPREQNETLATQARRLTKEDGKIDWKEEPVKIERKIRAFTPWPGTWSFIQLDQIHPNSDPLRIKILKSHLENNLLVIDEVQLEGKTPVPYSQFKSTYPTHQLL